MGKKRKLLLKIIGVSGLTLAGMECINRLLFRLSVKNAEEPGEENIHKWKKGSFYFEKRIHQNQEDAGHAPILILHDLYPDQSSDSCSHLADQLSKKRTVYLMDLLGCGRSDKPAITYVNYLYVLQVMEMIDNVIKEPVHLVAYGRSSAIAIAAAHNQPDHICHLTLIDPEGEEGKRIPNHLSKLRKKWIELPVVGPFVYNLKFKMNEKAHLGGMNARYLFASIAGNYTNWNTDWMLEHMGIPIHVITTEEKAGMEEEGAKA